jgi:hypothetical protein
LLIVKANQQAITDPNGMQKNAREDRDNTTVMPYSPRGTRSPRRLSRTAKQDFLKALDALEEATGRKHPAHENENRKGVDDDKERPGRTHNATNSPHHDSASF